MTATTDTVSAFIGIANENEFFSHHYLAEVFRGDVEETLAHWRASEEARPGDDTRRARYNRLCASPGTGSRPASALPVNDPRPPA